MGVQPVHLLAADVDVSGADGRRRIAHGDGEHVLGRCESGDGDLVDSGDTAEVDVALGSNLDHDLLAADRRHPHLWKRSIGIVEVAEIGEVGGIVVDSCRRLVRESVERCDLDRGSFGGSHVRHPHDSCERSSIRCPLDLLAPHVPTADVCGKRGKDHERYQKQCRGGNDIAGFVVTAPWIHAGRDS